MSITGSGQEDYIQSLLFGHSWTGTVGTGAIITYSYDLDEWITAPITWQYDSSGIFTNWSNINTLNSSYQAATDRAFTLWSHVANLSFTQDNTLGNNTNIVIRRGESSTGIIGSTSPNYNVSGTIVPITTTGVPVPDQIARADIIIQDQTGSTSAAPGTEASITILHEIGHALGLKHPFDTGGQDPNTAITDGSINTSLTIMAYDPDSSTMGTMPITPMLYDISTIQYLYGVNTTYNQTDNAYILDGTHSLDGNVYTGNLPSGYTFVGETIWDAGGVDTIDASSYAQGTKIDLRSGADYYSEVGETRVWNAYHADIENAIGGGGDDVIHGNDAIAAEGQYSAFDGKNTLDGGYGDDQIYGHAGDDILIGNVGSDTLDGGDGIDTASYADSNVTINIDVAGNAIYQGSDVDSLTSVERILGSGAAYDTLDLSNHSWAGAYELYFQLDAQGKAYAAINAGVANLVTSAADVELLEFSDTGNKFDIDLVSGSAISSIDTAGGNDDVTITLEPYGGPGNYSALHEVYTGDGDDTVIVRGVDPELTVSLGNGNDTIKLAAEGSVVYGDAGADTFWLGKDYLIADATPEDHISLYGIANLTGGIRWAGSESPWALGMYGVKYGMNTAGELIIRDMFGNDTYVANFNTAIEGPHTAVLH